MYISAIKYPLQFTIRDHIAHIILNDYDHEMKVMVLHGDIPVPSITVRSCTIVSKLMFYEYEVKIFDDWQENELLNLRSHNITIVEYSDPDFITKTIEAVRMAVAAHCEKKSIKTMVVTEESYRNTRNLIAFLFFTNMVFAFAALYFVTEWSKERVTRLQKPDSITVVEEK